MSATSATKRTPPTTPAAALPDIEQIIALRVDAAVQAKLAELQKCAPRQVFTGDDQIFLTWVLGFTAGANLERDGERGERIFARCKAIHEKLAPVQVPKTEVNPS